MTTTAPRYLFDPFEWLELEHPDWHVTTADLGGRGRELFCWEQKLVILDLARFDGDAVLAFTHAIAHIENHDPADEAPRELQEAEAEMLVALRLGISRPVGRRSRMAG